MKRRTAHQSWWPKGSSRPRRSSAPGYRGPFGGANLNAAAVEAGVHRNTIAYWRHTSPAFEAALRDAQTDRADMLREGAVARAELAFQALNTAK